MATSQYTPSCTPLQEIEAAYLHHIMGLTQAQIATALKITNHGRINEGIKRIEKAVKLSEGGYKDREGEDHDTGRQGQEEG